MGAETTALIDGGTTEVLQSIIEQSKSDTILFAIIILLGLIAVAIPMYKMMLSNKTKEKEIDVTEKEQILGVIERNTKVMTSLESTIRNTNDRLFNEINDQKTKLKEMHELMVTIHGTSKKILSNGETVLRDVSKMTDSVHGLETKAETMTSALKEVSIHQETINKDHDKISTKLGDMSEREQKLYSMTKEAKADVSSVLDNQNKLIDDMKKKK